ncbi:hypothetical protein BD770DRAFT_378033 [Pilaira anomala]|nr:hypothetical protein BD770DRAFT_378033 [Pilaira anomala]
MNLNFLFTFLLYGLIDLSFAASIDRFESPCGYLNKKIFCFGGLTMVNKTSVSDSIIYTLDIVNNKGLLREELSTKWEPIPPYTNGVEMHLRESSQSMALPDGKTMLLSGGWNSEYTSLISQTIAFNVDRNEWTEYPSYEEPPFGNRQIYSAASVYVPGYGVGFYGGVETNINSTWTYQGQNLSQYVQDTERNIGYTSLTFFDITKENNHWSIFSPQNNLPTVFPRFLSSIFDPKRNRILFFGGTYGESVSTHQSLGSAIAFDLTSGAWGMQTLGGDKPSDRSFHSTTLLQSTGRHVLLYGGERFDIVSVDYCYTLNLDTYSWSQQNITGLPNTELIRTRHSAISVDNNTVIISFGLNQNENHVSSLLILNVTDPLNVSSLNEYREQTLTNEPEIPKGSDSSDIYEESGLSKGTTAGIAVGAAAGCLIIIGIIFCLWKKKNKDKRKKREAEELANRNEFVEEPVIEVDWEEIDKSYGDFTPNLAKNVMPSPPLADDSTTVVNSHQSIASPMVSAQKPYGAELHNPNTIDDDSTNNIPHLTMLQKPDGGH